METVTIVFDDSLLPTEPNHWITRTIDITADWHRYVCSDSMDIQIDPVSKAPLIFLSDTFTHSCNVGKLVASLQDSKNADEYIWLRYHCSKLIQTIYERWNDLRFFDG